MITVWTNALLTATQGRSQDFWGLVSFQLLLKVPALGTSEAGPAVGGMGACSPRNFLKNMSDFLFSRDKFTVHTRSIKLYSS